MEYIHFRGDNKAVRRTLAASMILSAIVALTSDVAADEPKSTLDASRSKDVNWGIPEALLTQVQQIRSLKATEYQTFEKEPGNQAGTLLIQSILGVSSFAEAQDPETLKALAYEGLRVARLSGSVDAQRLVLSYIHVHRAGPPDQASDLFATAERQSLMANHAKRMSAEGNYLLAVDTVQFMLEKSLIAKEYFPGVIAEQLTVAGTHPSVRTNIEKRVDLARVRVSFAQNFFDDYRGLSTDQRDQKLLDAVKQLALSSTQVLSYQPIPRSSPFFDDCETIRESAAILNKAIAAQAIIDKGAKDQAAFRAMSEYEYQTNDFEAALKDAEQGSGPLKKYVPTSLTGDGYFQAGDLAWKDAERLPPREQEQRRRLAFFLFEQAKANGLKGLPLLTVDKLIAEHPSLVRATLKTAATPVAAIISPPVTTSPASKPVPAAQESGPTLSERAIAVQLLTGGATVSVVGTGKPIPDIASAADLPPEEFHITIVKFNGHQNDNLALIHLLRSLPSLQTVVVSNYEGKTATFDFSVIASLQHVKGIEITNSTVAAATIEHITKIPTLYKLRIDGIGDESIPLLLRLTSLRELSTVKTTFSALGLQRLKSGLPQCRSLQ